MGDHGHSHDHHHGHDHAPADFGRAFALGIALNLGFVAVEAGVGLAGGSMALLADAGHNLSDVLGLAIAWAAAMLSKRSPSKHFTYGLRGSSILAATANALLLLVAVGAILTEAVRRLIEPQPVQGDVVMIVAGVGIVVNGVTAWLFARGRKGDLNIRAAYLHMLADAAVSAAVVAAGLAIRLTGAEWIDPAAGILVAVVIFWGTAGLLKDSLRMSLAGVPPGIDLHEVERALAAMPGVARVHDLHVWPMSTTEPAMTAHLVMPGGHPGDTFFAALEERMQARFSICHCTVQIELAEAGACRLEPDAVV